MTWTIWATCPAFRYPRRYEVAAPSAATACAFVLSNLRRGEIIDCAPLAEVVGVRL